MFGRILTVKRSPIPHYDDVIAEMRDTENLKTFFFSKTHI